MTCFQIYVLHNQKWLQMIYLKETNFRDEVTEFVSRECHLHQTRAENQELNLGISFLLKIKYLSKKTLPFWSCRKVFVSKPYRLLLLIFIFLYKIGRSSVFDFIVTCLDTFSIPECVIFSRVVAGKYRWLKSWKTIASSWIVRGWSVSISSPCVM